jgi:hypothetical protein
MGIVFQIVPVFVSAFARGEQGDPLLVALYHDRCRKNIWALGKYESSAVRAAKL